MSLAMNLWKASDTLEANLVWYRRKRYILGVVLGVFINAAMDAVALSLAPLSLIAPLQGVGIAFTVLFAALGVVGHQENVSLAQWRAIGFVIVGLVLCSWYGPMPEAEVAWWPLMQHYYQPRWIAFTVLTYAIAGTTLLLQSVPAVATRLKGTVAWTLVLCVGSGILAGLLQTQLKVLGQGVRSFGYSPKVSCREAPAGYCWYNVDVCPGIFDVYAWDPICAFQVWIMGRTIPAYPVHWLVQWNGWFILPSAVLSLNMMTSALASSTMAVSVPLYSSSVLIFTVVAGALYFEEVSQMDSLGAFGAGVLCTIIGLVVLAREKGRAEEAAEKDTNSGQSERMLPDSDAPPGDARA